jgi:hypothetical protein
MGVGVEPGRDRRRGLGRWQAWPQVLTADAYRQLPEEDLAAVALGRGVELLEVGEADPGAEQHREAFDQGALHAAGANSILVGRSCPEHRDDVDVRAPRGRVAADDAAVEVAAVQTRAERLGYSVIHGALAARHNENTNRLLRQYLSKIGNLTAYDQQALDAIAARLNGRPRVVLGWHTPAAVLAAYRPV